MVKTMGDIPENVNVLSSETAPAVAVYKPGVGLLDKGRKDSVTIGQLSGVPMAMEELYRRPAMAAFKAKDAAFSLKSLSSSTSVAFRMAKAGLAVALMSSLAAVDLEKDGLAMKQISDGASLAARYCLLVQRGNYRSQVVNNFLSLLAGELGIDLGDALPAPEPEEQA